MKPDEYLIFRHTISKKKYVVPVNFDAKQGQTISPDVFEQRLKAKISNFGCCLSGGLDSSLLAAIYKPKKVYTCVFEDKKYDESKWAEIVAKHIGSELVKVPITKERYTATLGYLIRLKNDGLHPNEPCLYLLARQAYKDGLKVLVSGEGADDCFGGYTDLLENEAKYMKDEKTFLNRYAYVKPPKAKIDFETYKKWGMERFILKVHTPGLVERAKNAGRATGVHFVFPYLLKGIPQLAWQLRKEDKKNKQILKEIAKKYLPKEIIEREKVGFPVPLDEWFGGLENFMRLNIEIWS